MTAMVLMVKYFLSSTLRNIYWFFRLAKAKIGKNVKIKFPVKIEGQGQLVIKDNVRIGTNCLIAIAKGSSIRVGTGTSLETNVKLITAENSKLNIHQDVKLLDYTHVQSSGQFEINQNAVISTYCSIFSREPGCNGNFFLGKGSIIGDYTLIDVSGDCIIEDFVSIGPHSLIYTHNHHYLNSEIRWKGVPKIAAVHIEFGAWVGANVIILPGVKIGKGAVIAAGSVVTKSVGENEVVGGVPAKILN